MTDKTTDEEMPCDKCGRVVLAGGCPYDDAACPQFPEDAKRLQNKTTDWQPIETAPKEPRDEHGYGPTILLFDARGDGVDAGRTIAIGQWGIWEHGPHCWCMEAGDGWTAPTHWMPLPKPPVGDQP